MGVSIGKPCMVYLHVLVNLVNMMYIAISEPGMVQVCNGVSIGEPGMVYLLVNLVWCIYW